MAQQEKVMIAGSRGGGSASAVNQIATWSAGNGHTLVTGDATGVDTQAAQWAKQHGQTIDIHRVQGPRTVEALRARTTKAVSAADRIAVINQQTPEGRPRHITPGSRLTVKLAQQQGKPVIVFGADTNTLPKEPGGAWTEVPGWPGWQKYKPPDGPKSRPAGGSGNTAPAPKPAAPPAPAPEGKPAGKPVITTQTEGGGKGLFSVEGGETAGNAFMFGLPLVEGFLHQYSENHKGEGKGKIPVQLPWNQHLQDLADWLHAFLNGPPPETAPLYRTQAPTIPPPPPGLAAALAALTATPTALTAALTARTDPFAEPTGARRTGGGRSK